MKTFGFKTRKEFREKFPDRCADTKEAESFLSESIQQAVAEERERLVREVKEMRIRFNKKNILMYKIEIENYNMAIDDVISSFLDKPLTDGEK